MKNTIVLLLLLVSSGMTSIVAQDDDQHTIPKEKLEEIKAQKSAYITTKLQLTSDQAQLFWPIYNEFDAKQSAIRSEFREQNKALRDRPTGFTEEQANAQLEKTMENRQKELDLERQFNEKFKKAIGAIKTVELHRAERDFNREVLRRLKEQIGRPRDQRIRK